MKSAASPLSSHRIMWCFIAFIVGIAVACATLPDVGGLRERQPAPYTEPNIISAHGELPEGKKQALLERLEAQAGASDILARHVAAEERISGAPLVAGNKVVLLDDGPMTIRAMTNAIRGARDHVNLETYIFEDDEVGRALADLLIEKQAAGVRVNLIYDSAGTVDTPRAFFERLRAAGIRTLEFNPVNPLQAQGDWELNRRDHRKLLVVDGRVAFTGGVNISRVYGKSSALQRHREALPENAKEAVWRDTHMQIEGPVVAEFQKLFLETWRRKTGAEAAPAHYFPSLQAQGKALVRALGSTPEHADYTIYQTYISALSNADRTVHLTMAYFVPDRQTVQSMLDAARRGVDVAIVFPSFTDVGMILYAGRAYYDRLLAAGVRIYERKSAMLHAKTAVIDGVWSTIGSTNLDMRSFLHNDEVNAVVLDAEFADRMEALFRRDLAESAPVTLEQWRRRSVMERIKEWAVQLFDYWL